jgi:hypothetical protein
MFRNCSTFIQQSTTGDEGYLTKMRSKLSVENT